MFTFHELSLLDAVGHDYGPHHEAMRDALVETDKRIGKILAVLDRRGLFESTLFVVTADHGMAPTDIALAADPAQAVMDAGLKVVVTSPLIYLLDLEVVIQAAPDGRTATVTVRENDADASGEKPPVDGASVSVIMHAASPLRTSFESLRTSGKGGRDQGELAEARTDAHGVAGLPLPVGVDPASLMVRVEHKRFNVRNVRLDGSNVVKDVRAALYGART